MKKVDVNDLSGIELDYAVTVAEAFYDTEDIRVMLYGSRQNLVAPCLPEYSYLWHESASIIEREKLSLQFIPADLGEPDQWRSCKVETSGDHNYCSFGASPLEAAMRCYVKSKLGNEIEIPE